jgi:spore maturation protein CgeB
MRWLVALPGPDFSVADVATGWIEALSNLDRLAFYDSVLLPVTGRDDQFHKALTPEQAIELATNGLASALWKIHPQVLLVVSGFFTDIGMFDQARRYGTKVVVLGTEEPYEFSRGLTIAPHADLNLLNDPTNIDQYRQLAPAEYMPHAYRERIHAPGPIVPDLVCDLAFVGTGYPSRVEFLEAMNLDGLDVLLGGNWMHLPEGSPLRQHVGHNIDQCMANMDAIPLYRSARAGLNLYRREAEAAHLSAGWACGPREIEQAACGLFFLRDPRGESDELFPMLPSFIGPEDASEQLRWWLAHDEARADAADLARKAVADRTFTQNAKRLLRLLERQPVTV